MRKSAKAGRVLPAREDRQASRKKVRLHDAHRHDLWATSCSSHPLMKAMAAQRRGLAKRGRRALEQQRNAREAGDVGAIEKHGAFTGHYAINPFTRERLPVWVANYILLDYGTGAIMSVPAHDERDYEFAKKYGLEIEAWSCRDRRTTRRTATRAAAAVYRGRQPADQFGRVQRARLRGGAAQDGRLREERWASARRRLPFG